MDETTAKQIAKKLDLNLNHGKSVNDYYFHYYSQWGGSWDDYDEIIPKQPSKEGYVWEHSFWDYKHLFIFTRK